MLWMTECGPTRLRPGHKDVKDKKDITDVERVYFSVARRSASGHYDAERRTTLGHARSLLFNGKPPTTACQLYQFST